MARSQLERQLADLDRLKQRGTITEEEHALRRAAILAAPEASPAAGRKGSRVGGIFKWGFLGCLGLMGAVVVLGVVLVIIIAAAAGSGDGDDSLAAGPGEVGTNPGDVHVTLAANATGEIAPQGDGDKLTRVTILQIGDNVTSSNSFVQPAAGKKW